MKMERRTMAESRTYLESQDQDEGDIPRTPRFILSRSCFRGTRHPEGSRRHRGILGLDQLIKYRFVKSVGVSYRDVDTTSIRWRTTGEGSRQTSVSALISEARLNSRARTSSTTPRYRPQVLALSHRSFFTPVPPPLHPYQHFHG